MKDNLELTSQVTQMRTHYCSRDADHLKENTEGKKKKESEIL